LDSLRQAQASELLLGKPNAMILRKLLDFPVRQFRRSNSGCDAQVVDVYFPYHTTKMAEKRTLGRRIKEAQINLKMIHVHD